MTFEKSFDLPAQESCVILAAAAMDVREGRMISPAAVAVENGRISAIGPKAKSRKAGRSVDLGNTVLLPGLHDNHCHLMLEPKNFDTLIYKRSSAAMTLDACLNARKALMAGFTTLRDPGDCDRQFGLVDLKRAIDAGKLPGPRLIIAPHFLSPTGGHGDANDFAWDLQMAGIGRIVNGVDEMRKAVREEIKYGADWVKIFVSGGVLSKGDDPTHCTYSIEEIKTAADETHRLGRRITAHAHGDAAIQACVRAGFDGIEHCTMVDDNTIPLMKKNGVFCVPTLYVLDFLIRKDNGLELTADIVAKAQSMRHVQREQFRKIVRAKVPVAYGTDIGVFPHGENWRDFLPMTECGMSPIDAIRTATLQSARMNGIEGDVGTIETGKCADIIGIAGNPLKDISSLSRVVFVMRDGRIYKCPGGQV